MGGFFFTPPHFPLGLIIFSIPLRDAIFLHIPQISPVFPFSAYFLKTGKNSPIFPFVIQTVTGVKIGVVTPALYPSGVNFINLMV